MNCNRAKELIDLKLADALTGAKNGVRIRATDDSPDKALAALAAHLADCPRCAADQRELTRTRGLLTALAADGPTEQELDSILAALRSGRVGTAHQIEATGQQGIEATRNPELATRNSSLVGSAHPTQHSALRTQDSGLRTGEEAAVPLRAARRSLLRPMAAASLAVAACLMIAFLIGQWHYEGTILGGLTLDADARRPSIRAGLATAAPVDDGAHMRANISAPSAPKEQELERLRALGYASGGGDDKEHDWYSFDKISMGYQAPFGPTATEPKGLADAQTDQPQGRGTDFELVGKELASAGGLGFDPRGVLSGEVVVGPPSPSAPLLPEGSPESVATGVRRIPLANIDAGDVAEKLEMLFASEGQTGDSEGPASSAGSRGVLRFSADPDSNTLALSGAVADLDMAERLAKLIDAQTGPKGIDQVYTAGYSTSKELSEAMGQFIAEETARLGQIEGAGPATDQPDKQSSEKTPPNLTSRMEEPSVKQRAKIIKTGELGLEVPEYESALKLVRAIVEQFEAFVADVNTQERTGGAVTGRVAIRVIPEQFEALFAALKPVGRVEAENVKAADVTAQYVDLEARITAAQITEARLQELIKNKSIIDKMSALLEVERELARVRSEIEQMQGQLRVMADRVALSTITVALREPDRILPSAALAVEVPVLAAAAEALGKALGEHGGRLTSGKVSRREDGTFRGDYELEVPLKGFDAVRAAIEALGRVEDRQLKDREFTDTAAPWADEVKCKLALVLYEGAGELPKGEITLEVDQVGDAVNGLGRLLDAYGASVRSNRTQRRDDGSSMAELGVLVPAGRYAEFTSALETLGRTLVKRLAGEMGRIDGGMADVLCSLSLKLAERPRQVPSGSMAVEVDGFEAARRQISSLVAEKGVQVLASSSEQRSDGTTAGSFRLGIKSADMEAVVARLESLGRVGSRSIVGIGLGDLSTVDPDTLGVIELSLGEKPAIAPGRDRAGQSIRARLTDGLAGLYQSLGLMLYGLVALAPWLVIVLAGGWVVARVVRRRRRTVAAAE